MQVTIIGAGYVGLTTALSLAYLGHELTCIDVDEQRIELLQQGQLPIHEPHLDTVMREVGHRIQFRSDYTPELVDCDIALICVGTPPHEDGNADLRFVEQASTAIAEAMQPGEDMVVVNKSTVPVGSARRVSSVIERVLRDRGVERRVAVASNPEFLREGAALHDTLYPDRIVVGADAVWAVNALRELYEPILEQSFTPPKGLPRPEGIRLPAFVTMNTTSAELVKYASNAFLAMKISYANEIAGVADRVGADITEVMRAVGLDDRIGSRYLGAGAGWGGSCFGKDIRAMLALGEQYGYELPLSRATLTVNLRQRKVIVEKLQENLKVLRGSTIALWGLSFKPNTDDLRDAPALDIARRLISLGVHVKAYDPVALERCQRECPELDMEYACTYCKAVQGADAVVLVTEWEEFFRVKWDKVADAMRGDLFVDGRNVFEPERIERCGLTYVGVGR